jgi:hypothetical protein
MCDIRTEKLCYHSQLSLQRYLMKYLVKAPFPVGEIRPMLALLHPGHKPQDVIRLEDFEG